MARCNTENACHGPAINIYPAVNGVLQQIRGQTVFRRIQQCAGVGLRGVIEFAHEVAAHQAVEVEALHIPVKRACRHRYKCGRAFRVDIVEHRAVLQIFYIPQKMRRLRLGYDGELAFRRERTDAGSA